MKTGMCCCVLLCAQSKRCWLVWPTCGARTRPLTLWRLACSIAEVLLQVDMAIQYGEDMDVKEADFDPPDNDNDNDD